MALIFFFKLFNASTNIMTSHSTTSSCLKNVLKIVLYNIFKGRCMYCREWKSELAFLVEMFNV